MKIVSYNIQFGLGKDGQNDLARICREVAGADIIALQEVERFWQHSGNVDQPALLADLLPDYYWVYGPYFDVDASSRQADGRLINRRRQFGNMILSRTPILSSRLFPLPKTALRKIDNMAVGLFEAVINLETCGALRLYNAHLGARLPRDRSKQIIALKDIIQRAPLEGGPWTGETTSPLWQEGNGNHPMPKDFVLLGDFNLEPGDNEYDHLVGPLDGDGLRTASRVEFIDSWVAAGNREDSGVTFPANPEADALPDLRLDYIFVPPGLRNRIVSAGIDSTAQGSDHQPVWLELADDLYQ
ncbi:endonuclease/exonuclease/phosphatase family protein [Rhodovibrionaceae bacterium A322]